MGDEYYPGRQVRLLIEIGKRLKPGAIGVIHSVADDLYPNDISSSQYYLTVIFPALGNKFDAVHPDIPNIEPSSVPHHNAVPLRLREVELVEEHHHS